MGILVYNGKKGIFAKRQAVLSDPAGICLFDGSALQKSKAAEAALTFKSSCIGFQGISAARSLSELT